MGARAGGTRGTARNPSPWSARKRSRPVPIRSEAPSAPFLFSVDLEDVRDMIPAGSACREAVPENTLRYLDWLETMRASCTFFVVGRTARAYPDLIREILHKGHEVACHSDDHRPLAELGPR